MTTIETDLIDVTDHGDLVRHYLVRGWWINGKYVLNPALLPEDHGKWGWVIEKDGEVVKNLLGAPEILYQYDACERVLDLEEAIAARPATEKEIEEYESAEDARYY